MRSAWWRLLKILGAFRAEESGQILIIFALSSLGIFAGLGAGVDLSAAYAARQRLSEVATLACQYSTRPSVAQTAAASYSGSNGFQTYVSAINAFAAASLVTQHWNNATPSGPTGTAGNYFTATPASGTTGAAAVPSNPAVEMSASIPTSFGKILNLTSIPVHAKIACQTLTTAPQVVNPQLLLKEGFEAPCSGSFCSIQARPGSSGFSNTPTNTFPNAPQYVGYNGYSWSIVGYCLETDSVGIISPSVPEGSHSAELDCDNGSGSAGNSSISTKLSLEGGNYELRYYYRSRIDYPDYDPTYVCGTTAGDVVWANDSNSSGGPRSNAVRTNQINVYLDQNQNGTAPLHQTIDGTQYLAGSNLIDTCVYSPTWVQRSVRVKVTTPGDYWLSFAADGANDSYGGQLDLIQFCQGSCTDPLQDNFPSAWLPGNNNYVNKVLFEDTFEQPTYSASASQAYVNQNGDPFRSTGTSGTSGSGWPSLAASGWLAAPYDQVDYGVYGAAQGSQYISLDGYNANGNTATNRVLSRPFLLDPGYYQVTYNFVPTISFPGYVSGTYCAAAPASGQVFPNTTGYYAPGHIRNGGAVSAYLDTDLLGVFMSHSTLVSTPNGSSSQGAATTYSNPDGSVSATPTVPPDTVNWQSYNAAVNNPVIDACGYSDAWVARSVAVQINKPGMYWLTFSSTSGTADKYGPSIDDVKLTALGSPSMANPPVLAAGTMTSIPVPAPAPGSTLALGSNSGFTIVADPFVPPAAQQ